MHVDHTTFKKKYCMYKYVFAYNHYAHTHMCIDMYSISSGPKLAALKAIAITGAADITNYTNFILF